MSKKEIARGEFYEKYKDVNFKFLSYYNFTFTYRGFTSDGEEVKVSLDWYLRAFLLERVNADDVYGIVELQPYQGESDSVTFYDFT